MIINPGPQMGYSELVELYGEELGFSIGKTLRKTKNVVKAVAKPVAKTVVKAAGVVARNPATIATGGLSLLAPKSVQKTLNTAAAATVTGGASLVATKSGRNLVGKTARAVQSNVLRPVTHAVIRSPVVQKAAVSAVRSFVPGGSAALDAANMVSSLKKKKAAVPLVAKKIALPAAFKPAKVPPLKLKAPAQRSAAGQVGARPYRPPAMAPAPAAAEAPAASPFPILPVAIGGAGLLLVAVMAMGKRK